MVCIEIRVNAAQKAQNWLAQRARRLPNPLSVDEASFRRVKLVRPARVSVRPGAILNHRLTGSPHATNPQASAVCTDNSRLCWFDADYREPPRARRKPQHLCSAPARTSVTEEGQ